MESAHDQTRQHADQLVQALKLSKTELLSIKIKVLHIVPSPNLINLGSLVEIENLGTKQIIKYLIVPEGLGGKAIEGVVLLGENTPLTKAIFGQKTGYVYEMNRTKFIIKNISSNC